MTQPNQPQYPITALTLFPCYGNRAAYLQATGRQPPPFDPSQPIKGWADTAGGTYLYFDNGAASANYVGQMTLTAAQAASINLPGAYTYPAYNAGPTDAVAVGPYGPIGNVQPNRVCAQADAQAIANEVAALFHGQTPAVAQENNGVYHIAYMLDPRREWYVQFGNQAFLAEQLIEQKTAHGIGSPGHWTLASSVPVWIYDAPVIVAPPDAATVPVPIRALLPNERIVHLPGSLFSQQGTWVVERSDLAQAPQPESNDQQFAEIKGLLARIAAKLGV